MRSEALARAFVSILAVIAFTAARAGADSPSDATQSQLESDLTCQCGCGLTVHSCNHLNCSSGIPLKQEIATQLAEGKPRTEVLAHFESKYGEKVLAAPTTRGFNLAAWTVPFVAIGIAGLGIAIALARSRRTLHASAGLQEGRSVETTDAASRARLDAALEDFERRR